MADFDINSHLQQMGFGRGKSGGDAKGGDSTNEKDIVEAAISGGEKTAQTLSKFVGMNLSQLGQVSVTQPLDSEGLTGKMIMPSVMPDMGGGWLAKLLHSIFIKNSAITDGTAGTGGGSSGDYASGGGGGGGGGDFSSEGFPGGSVNFSSMASHSHDFEWSAISLASLGGLPRPALPDMGPSMGEGMSMG